MFTLAAKEQLPLTQMTAMKSTAIHQSYNVRGCLVLSTKTKACEKPQYMKCSANVATRYLQRRLKTMHKKMNKKLSVIVHTTVYYAERFLLCLTLKICCYIMTIFVVTRFVIIFVKSMQIPLWKLYTSGKLHLSNIN